MPNIYIVVNFVNKINTHEMEKVALITGANKGLGFETAYQLGIKGYTIIVTARTQQKSNETAEKLISKGIKALGMQ
ncbi:hypothetical protein LBMAG24_15860 [Bacteroidota bacterium]|nr:hypothetical protein LBMAG24_15860 [Bacteroidota bacterium]